MFLPFTKKGSSHGHSGNALDYGSPDRAIAPRPLGLLPLSGASFLSETEVVGLWLRECSNLEMVFMGIHVMHKVSGLCNTAD